jgi:hypothetical protein
VLPGAAKADLCEWSIAPTGIFGGDDAGCIAARAVDVQLQALQADVANGLKRKRTEHGPKRNAAAAQEPLCQQ